MEFNEEKLKEILSNVFNIDKQSIDGSCSPDTIETWDSMRHLNLVLALEDYFNITLSEEQIVEMMNYELIKEILREHGITFS